MGENQEKPFYVMMFFSLLAAGGVFVLATMVTVDGLKPFSTYSRVKFVFHRAVASAFGTFGAATGTGSIQGKLGALAADIASFLAATPASPAGRDKTIRGASGPYGPDGFNADLFDLARGLVMPRLPAPLIHGGRATTSSSEYYESGDVPGTLLAALPRRGRQAAEPSPAPPPPSAPSSPETRKPAPAGDRGTGNTPTLPAAGRNSGDAPAFWNRPEKAAKPGTPSKWDNPGAARAAADPDTGEFNLQSVKAGAIKNSAPAGNGTEPKAARAGQASGGSAAPAPAKVSGIINALTEKIVRASANSAKPRPASTPAALTQDPSTAAAPSTAPASSATSPAKQETGEITQEETQEINTVIAKALNSIQSGYGPMATLVYTDCADSPLCKEHQLKGGFLTMTTETGAVAQISAKKSDSQWQSYTIDFKPPPETEPED